MTNRSLLAALAVVAACLAGPVSAQLQAQPPAPSHSKFYIGGSVGSSDYDIEPGAINRFGAANVGPTATSSQSNDTGWKLQLGYEITTVWAVEGGYTNLGEAKYFTANPTYTTNGTSQAHLWNFDVVGRVPLGRSFTFLARAGVYRWETRTDLPFAGGTRRVDDDGVDFKFGVGLQYDFNPNFALRAEYERFNGVGEASSGGETKVNMFSLGAILKY